MENRYNALRLHPTDNIAVALRVIVNGEKVMVPEMAQEIVTRNEIPYGHKVALLAIQEGKDITKYGECMGISTEEILPGNHVHVHNVRGLNEEERLNIINKPVNT